ncbi:MAG TPA: hypothetical protein VGF75_05635 [Candidatus Saccharimonadales bacterium]|jgi:hypothetical protein
MTDTLEQNRALTIPEQAIQMGILIASLDQLLGEVSVSQAQEDVIWAGARTVADINSINRSDIRGIAGIQAGVVLGIMKAKALREEVV